MIAASLSRSSTHAHLRSLGSHTTLSLPLSRHARSITHCEFACKAKARNVNEYKEFI